jgi:competence protein ComEC
MVVSRPFVTLAGLLMGGIVAGRFVRLEFSYVLFALAAAAPFVFWKRTRLVAVTVSIFVLGATLYVARYRVASANDLRLILSGEPELVTVRGKLVESPEVREFQAGSREVAYSYATIDVSELQLQKEWRSASGRVAVRMRGELQSEFFKGRRVEVAGAIEWPAKATAPGLFDYRAYLQHTRIFYQLKSDSPKDWQLLSYETMPITERFRRWAQRQLQRGIPADEASETIAAMTLGLRNSMSGEMSDVFMRTGTMHIIAISGLHVACIAYFLSCAVRLFGLPRAIEGLIVIAVVWFYTAATGLQSSACRSALMATVFMLQWIMKRPPELLNSVAASAALILLVQPEQLFQASFQLSFSVVAVIGLAATLVETHYPNAILQVRHRIAGIDPLLPYELVPRRKKVAKFALGLLIGNFFVSLASWLGSMPLTAYYFYTVTPVSLAANLLAVPLSSVSLGATVVSILVPWVAPVSNYVAWMFMKWTIGTVEFFGSFSWGYFYVPTPNALFMVAYAAGIAVVFIPRLRAGVRKYASALVVAMLSMFWLGSVYAGKPLAQVTVLPCAGTPVLVEEGRAELLIDSSSARDADYMVKRFLRARGRGSVDGLVITHGDAQVVGGFEMMWNEFAAKRVYTSGVKMRSPGYRRAIEVLTEEPKRWETIGAGSEVQGWRVLYPEPGERGFPRADDNAVVMKKRIGAWTFLHLSELGEAGQKKLAEAGADLRADVVIAGMPEQGEPLKEELLELIRPRVIVLGTLEYPFTALGKPELRERLEANGAEVFYVNEEDAVTITVKAGMCVINTMAGRRAELK